MKCNEEYKKCNYSLGGEIRFLSQVSDIIIENKTIKDNNEEHIPVEVVLMGVEHSVDNKLAYNESNGRSAYTFCICPGGDVVCSA